MQQTMLSFGYFSLFSFYSGLLSPLLSSSPPNRPTFVLFFSSLTFLACFFVVAVHELLLGNSLLILTRFVASIKLLFSTLLRLVGQV